MSTTVANIIDELKRDYLFKPHEQPPTVPLTTTINDSVTTVNYDPNFLSAIEEDSIGNGSIIEIDSELMRVTHIDTTTRSLIVQRGVLGTSVASHTAAAIISVAPEISRDAMFKAVSDAIVNLGPRLYDKVTVQKNGSASYIEVPVTVEDVLFYRYKNSETSTTSVLYLEAAVELMKDLHTDVSSTTVAIQVQNVPAGRTGYLTYKAAFPRPTSEAYVLDDATNNIKIEWFMLVKLGALIRLMSSFDLSARNADFITDAIQTQGFPVGSGERVDLAIARIYQYLMREAEVWLMKDQPMQVLTNRPG